MQWGSIGYSTSLMYFSGVCSVAKRPETLSIFTVLVYSNSPSMAGLPVFISPKELNVSAGVSPKTLSINLFHIGAAAFPPEAPLAILLLLLLPTHTPVIRDGV